jgi:hypothetical protein
MHTLMKMRTMTTCVHVSFSLFFGVIHSHFVVLFQDFSGFGDDDFDGDEDAGENDGNAEGATPTSGDAIVPKEPSVNAQGRRHHKSKGRRLKPQKNADVEKASAEAIAKRKEDRARRLQDKPWLTGTKEGKEGKKVEPDNMPLSQPTQSLTSTVKGPTNEVKTPAQYGSVPFSPIKPRPKSTGPAFTSKSSKPAQKDERLRSPRSAGSLLQSNKSDHIAKKPSSAARPPFSRKRPRRQQPHRSVGPSPSCNYGRSVVDDVFEAQIVEAIVDDAFLEAFRNWGWTPQNCQAKVAAISKVQSSPGQNKKNAKQKFSPSKSHRSHVDVEIFEITLPEYMEPGSIEAEKYQQAVSKVTD